MATGADDMSKIGRVERWNYADHLPFFEKECAGVDGSSGTFYPPGRSREDPVWLFSPDMCRKLRFDYEKDVMVKDVLGYKYTGGDRTVDNGEYTVNQSNFNSLFGSRRSLCIILMITVQCPISLYSLSILICISLYINSHCIIGIQL